MEKNIKIYEKFLYEIWKDQQFENELVTKDGDKINVLDTGQQNRELGGPDFKNVRIKIGNIILVKGSQGARLEKIVQAIMAEPLRAGELLVRQGREWKK